jgi:hypothetical protein
MVTPVLQTAGSAFDQLEMPEAARHARRRLGTEALVEMGRGVLIRSLHRSHSFT